MLYTPKQRTVTFWLCAKMSPASLPVSPIRKIIPPIECYSTNDSCLISPCNQKGLFTELCLHNWSDVTGCGRLPLIKEFSLWGCAWPCVLTGINSFHDHIFSNTSEMIQGGTEITHILKGLLLQMLSDKIGLTPTGHLLYMAWIIH